VPNVLRQFKKPDPPEVPTPPTLGRVIGSSLTHTISPSKTIWTLLLNVNFRPLDRRVYVSLTKT